jgi:hypothetical protein
MTEKRNDTRCAVFVDAGIRVNTLWGCVSAWRYMRQRGVEREVAFRVRSPPGIHQSTDAPHPAARDKLAAQPDTGTDHEDVLRRVRDETDVPQSRRANDVTAAVCERAIAFAKPTARSTQRACCAFTDKDRDRDASLVRATFTPALSPPNMNQQKIICPSNAIEAISSTFSLHSFPTTRTEP